MNCEITKLIIIIQCDKHSSERKQRAGAPTQLWRERGFVKEETSNKHPRNLVLRAVCKLVILWAGSLG